MLCVMKSTDELKNSFIVQILSFLEQEMKPFFIIIEQIEKYFSPISFCPFC